ncbi:hypothetical protein LG047_12705 [Methylocystis sp. WRRC1]|uniref:hypothetical protein n=1 Tax=unclassified Methylocystis TaxID=2625913 RepID=UPI0001F8684C|nr:MULTISPECIES: hypothetical protein [unclassified Methylocystis]MCC3246170.1 hypothetical protein [Methylocystis sp. WRRC1]
MKKQRKSNYDRAAVMRRAHELRAGGMEFGAAISEAWREAKAAKAVATVAVKAQPSGARAALRRYGVDVDRAADLAARAVTAVKRAAREAIRRTAAPAALPHYGGAIDARKGADGVYRV